MLIKLGNLLKVFNGYAFQKKDYKESGVLLFRQTNLNDGEDNKKSVYVDNSYLKTYSDFIIEKGDILIGMSGSIGGFYTYNSNKPALQNQRVGKLVFYDNRFSKYILHYLPLVVDELNKKAKGVAVQNISGTDLENIQIPLVSLPHQTLIVDEIEKQLSRLESGMISLQKLQTLVKQYRASVLSSAVSGKLVPQDSSDEPASILLERILEAKKAKRLSENPGKKYKDPSPIDASELGDLPDGWCWTSFGVVCDVYVGSTPSRSIGEYRGGTINWVSSGEVHFEDIYSTKETITDLGLNNSSTTIHPKGTILVGMIGEGKTRGQVARLRIAACHNQNTAAIRVNQELINSDYIYYYLYGKYESLRSVGGGGNQKALNKGIIESIYFSLPPLAAQHHIVAEVERRFSVLDKLEQTITENITRANQLKQSILNQAFSGQLVDYQDDPVEIEALLEQIEQAKEEMKKKMKKKMKMK